MALLLKSNALFIHIPKTAGTYVIHVLERLGLVQAHVGREHANFPEVFWGDRLHHDDKVFRNLIRRRLGLLPKIDPNAFQFCFVREPLSWYVSYWRYMESLSWRRWGDDRNPYHWSPLSFLNGLGSSDFNQFIRNVNEKRPGFVTELYGWYVRPGVTFVGKQENARNDLLKIFELLNFNISPESVPAERHNQSPTRIAAPEWDPAVKRETLRLEYAGYQRYGYSADGAWSSGGTVA